MEEGVTRRIIEETDREWTRTCPAICCAVAGEVRIEQL